MERVALKWLERFGRRFGTSVVAVTTRAVRALFGETRDDVHVDFR